MGHPQMLRFRAAGTALVPNFEHEAAGIRSFIGRRKCISPDGRLGFEPSGVAECPFRAEYVKACKDGDLEAADEMTAKACGVDFVAEESA